MRQACLATRTAILVLSLSAPGTTLAQEAHRSLPPPMLFAFPRLELVGDDTRLLDGADVGFAFPLTSRRSVTGNYVWDKNGTDHLSATYNLDLPLKGRTVGRLSAGLIQDDLGVGIGGHRIYDDFGAGAFVNASARGDVYATIFLSTPLPIGVTLGNLFGTGRSGQVRRGGNVADLGAVATLYLKAGDGSRPEVATGTAWFPRQALDWPRAGGDAHSASVTSSDFSPPARASWSFQARGAIRGGPAVGGGVVYVGGEDGAVHALRLADGSPVWTAAVGAGATEALAVSGGRVYVGTRAGQLVCLRPPMMAEGIVAVEEWRFQTRGPVMSCPVVTAQGLVVFGSDDGMCYAVDARGRLVWSFATQGRVVAPVSLSARRLAAPGPDGAVSRPVTLVFCASTDGVLYALREHDGRPAWTFAANTPLHSAPAVLDDRLIIGTQDGAVYALETASGRLLWRQSLGAPVRASPAVADGRAYFACADGAVVALSLQDGRRLWTAEVFGQVLAAPIATRSPWLLVTTQAGMVYAVRRTDGRIMWAVNAQERITTGPAVASRYLVFGGESGRVQAYEPGGQWRVDPPPVVVTAPPGEAPQPLKLDLPKAEGEIEDKGARASAPVHASVTPPAGPAAAAGPPAPGVSIATVGVQEDFPSPTMGKSGPQVSAMAGRVAMTLLTSTPDPRQPPIMVADRPSVVVSGIAPPGTVRVLVNDTPVTLTDGEFRAALAFHAAGAYPLTIKYVDAADQAQMDERIVMVSPEERPTSAAPVFFSPHPWAADDGVRFTVSWDSAGDQGQVSVLEIRDPAGRAIRAWADVGSGPRTFLWDGSDQWGKTVPDGQYLAVYTVRDMDGRSRSMYQPVVVETTGM